MRFVVVSHPNPWRQSSLQKPSLRGVLHSWCAGISMVVGIVLVATAPTWRAGLLGAVFAVSVTLMFTVSAVFHRRFWSDAGWATMRKLDQSAIYLLVGGSYTGIVGLGLDGGRRNVLLLAVWIGVLLGLWLIWSPVRAPTGLQTTLFIALGWTAVFGVSGLWNDVGAAETVMVGAGGVLYTVGAILLGLRWPDLVEGHFGYHEVWHVLVTVAVGLHYAVVFRIVAMS